VSAEPIDREVAAATLACLPGITPARLRLLVEHWGGVVGALHAVRRGQGARVLPPGVNAALGSAARAELGRVWAAAADPAPIAATLARRGTQVLLAGGPGYPIDAGVPGRPEVLLVEGNAPAVLDRPRVAVVGTRSATPHGLADARALGAALAESGVTVVSGLAIGIDGAVHEGALEAGGGVVGVVATGLDVVYPRRHVTLFDRVRRAGVIVSETGFGVPPEAARFPVRNRIIAALADVTVVVEATLRGGARITAEYALAYDRAVLAMPGSRRNSAAAGCNALLADGAHPMLEPSDVLIAIGLSPGSRRPGPASARPEPGADGARVLRACGGEPATSDQLASRCRLSAEQVAVALAGLERGGWISRSRGFWWPV
jgi:DNA processing protein